MLKCAGVVVIYNPDNHVINNIKSYIDQVSILYIVDNTENECDIGLKLERNFPDMKYEYIGLKKNIGLAAALNIGIKKAIKEGYEWILTMDQDSSFYNEIIDIYYQYIEKHDTDKVAIIAPQYKTDRIRLKKTVGYKKIYWTMQSADFINLNAMKKLGLLENSYFIDCIDYEYCLRARKNHYQIVCCNEAILNHSPATTKIKKFGTIKLKYGCASSTRSYYKVRNSLYMFQKYHNFLSLGIVIKEWLKILILYDNKQQYFLKFYKAINDFKNGIMGQYI